MSNTSSHKPIIIFLGYMMESNKRPPTNLYSPEFPLTVTVQSVTTITGPTAPLKTCHVVFEHQGFLPYWEGQQVGIMPAPDNPFKPGDAAQLKRFSVASSRYGDSGDSKTASFCVQSVPGTLGEKICNSRTGDKFQFTGPNREALLLGDYEANASHIFVATGSAVAPFRAHLYRFFKEHIPNFNFRGRAWLFFGVINQDSLLYDEEFQEYLENYPNNFQYNVQYNLRGTEDVTTVVTERVEEIFNRLQKRAYIYFAGISEMEIPVKEALRAVAERRGMDWDNIFGNWKRNSQWRVEVHAERHTVAV